MLRGRVVLEFDNMGRFQDVQYWWFRCITQGRILDVWSTHSKAGLQNKYQ